MKQKSNRDFNKDIQTINFEYTHGTQKEQDICSMYEQVAY